MKLPPWISAKHRSKRFKPFQTKKPRPQSATSSPMILFIFALEFVLIREIRVALVAPSLIHEIYVQIPWKFHARFQTAGSGKTRLNSTKCD